MQSLSIWQSVLVASYSYMWAFNSYAAPICHPALDPPSEEQATFARPFALFGRLHRGVVGGCVQVFAVAATSSPIRS